MRYFDDSGRAARYHRYRPRVHGRVVREVLRRRAGAVRAALDVACGTGHSTAALADEIPSVVGCDVSGAMLSFASREGSAAAFVCGEAEALPFGPQRFDLVTVSMALHWLDQPRFLEEAQRVLAPGGELWAYNLFFPGVLPGDDSFGGWYREVYLSHYPAPARNSQTLAELLEATRAPLVFAGKQALGFEILLTAEQLRGYLTTQSNVEAALRQGAVLRDVDAWLDQQLAPFFGSESQRFAYNGVVEIAAAERAGPDDARQRVPRES